MKRDMDLVRKILLQTEEHEHGYAPQSLTIEDHSEDAVGFHIYLMGEAALLRVADVTSFGCKSPRAIPLNITWAGYEFLDAAREPTVWEAAKKKVSSAVVSVGFEVMKLVLAAIAKEKLGLG